MKYLGRIKDQFGWIALVWLVCCGCSQSGTQAISGSVTLDGAPLATGEIEFVPAAKTGGPLVGGSIEQGKYGIAAVAQGLKTGGVYAVRITSLQGRGRFVLDPNSPGRKREALENVIPTCYNEVTQLSVTISPGQATHDFALKSDASPSHASTARKGR